MAKARPIRGLSPDTRFRDAAAVAVSVRAEEVFSFADAALDLTDIEGVHDMRVATRRLRAALEVFATCFPRKQHAAALAEVKDLADRLGERRDPDVAIEELEALAAEFAPEDRPGVAGLVEELRAEQAAANETVARALADLHESGLAGRLQELAQAARS
ncbi:MAG TPA: CHAD domain-containing protein [Thermoleophilaceae bacterium]|nr:CHAD domain-containing protein [Thermoleophilaceae bacterium]